jgi:hypothetical protein
VELNPPLVCPPPGDVADISMALPLLGAVTKLKRLIGEGV